MKIQLFENVDLPSESDYLHPTLERGVFELVEINASVQRQKIIKLKTMN